MDLIRAGESTRADGISEDSFTRCLRRLERRPQGAEHVTALAQRYSYVVPATHLLEILRTLGPLIEIGAGTGYWAYRLRALGADIIAFDQAPPDGPGVNRYHGCTPTWTEVREGDHRVLAEHPDRALFLCWPPLFSALGECLEFYQGRAVACIGDGGFRTARLAGLTEHFAMVDMHPAEALEPFPGVQPTLSVWRR